MIYNYIFQSPVKYEINDEIKNFNDIKHYIDSKQVEKFIQLHTVNFKDFLNHEGLINVNFFLLSSGQTLKIIVQFDHPLTKKEFNSVYTDLQAQLIDGIGQEISAIPLTEYVDVNQDNNNDKKELKKIKKQIYCLLWQENDWKLIYITKHFYQQKNNKW